MNFLEQIFTRQQQVASKTTLVREGQIAQHLYWMRQGCLRIWLNYKGKDLTTQFFLENDTATCLDSFLSGQPSQYTLESIEPCIIGVLTKPEFDQLLIENEAFKNWFFHLLIQRHALTNQRLVAHLRDSPQQRYEDLLRTQPQLIQRVRQCYLASYLGVDRVSLSRIRGRLTRQAPLERG